MDLSNEAFISAKVSLLKTMLLSSDEISRIKEAKSIEDIWKVLNRSIYSELSSKMGRDVEENERLMINHLISLVNELKKFSSDRIKKIVELAYDRMFSFYNSIALFKGMEPVFEGYRGSYVISIDSFVSMALGELEMMKELLNNKEIEYVKKLILSRTKEVEIKPSMSSSVIIELVLYLYQKEKEINTILKSMRRLIWEE